MNFALYDNHAACDNEPFQLKYVTVTMSYISAIIT